MSEVKTNKVSPVGANGTVTLGDSGDTITVPSGVTFTNSGTATGFGKVLQVVSAIKTDTASTTSATLASTGLEATITLSATSSKVLILINAIQGTKDDVSPYFRLNRNSTDLTAATGDAAGSRTRTVSATQQQYSLYNNFPVPIIYLDSPSSTSALTYKLMWAQAVPGGGNTSYLNRSATDTDAASYMRSASTITLMEISG